MAYITQADYNSVNSYSVVHSKKSHCYCMNQVAFYSAPSHFNFPPANSSGVLDNAYLNIWPLFLKRATIQSTVSTHMAHSIKSHRCYTVCKYVRLYLNTENHQLSMTS